MNKNIKQLVRKALEENSFVDSVVNNADPSKPIVRKDLMNKPCKDIPTKKVLYAVEFPEAGTFVAVSNAEKYLKDMGYKVGPMNNQYPRGFTLNYEHVAKWTNLSREDQALVDGIIIPDPEFREGGAIILWILPPNL